MSKNNSCKKFEDILLESIDKALSTLGENVKSVIYSNLAQKFLIAREDIPYRIEDFSDVLEKIFGVGARNLEILIMSKLHAKIDCVYEWSGPKWLIPNLTFSQYVELLRLSYEDKRKIEEVEVWINAEEQKQRI